MKEEIRKGLEGSKDEATEKWVQERGESLKGFPFFANPVCECAFPLSLNSPLRRSHTNRTIICYFDSPGDKEEEREQEGGGGGGRGRGKEEKEHSQIRMQSFSISMPRHIISALFTFHMTSKSCSNS